MTRECNGLHIAKLFLDYCFSVSDMLTLNPPDEIIKNLKDYALKICDDCGGAMCDINCPVLRYIEDMDRWLKGERIIKEG